MKDLADCLILIVDDTEESVDILVETLGETYDIAVALDGETALEIATEDRPDLILLDIVMPGMNGFEVCEHLRTNEITRDIPVMFLSGQAGDEDRNRAAALGAVGFLTKPVDTRTLTHTVGDYLRGLLTHFPEVEDG